MSLIYFQVKQFSQDLRSVVSLTEELKQASGQAKQQLREEFEYLETELNDLRASLVEEEE